jgi:hypothetical protein
VAAQASKPDSNPPFGTRFASAELVPAAPGAAQAMPTAATTRRHPGTGLTLDPRTGGPATPNGWTEN